MGVPPHPKDNILGPRSLNICGQLALYPLESGTNKYCAIPGPIFCFFRLRLFKIQMPGVYPLGGHEFIFLFLNQQVPSLMMCNHRAG